MARRLDNWLQGYREYTSDQEAPETYHIWTGLSVIASSLRRNVWLDQGIYFLFPNLYVILVGPPGKMGKSTVLRMGRKLLFPLDKVTLGPDSCTVEELIRRMGKVDHDGQSAMTIHSSELSSLIEPSGLPMIQFLTDIYDCEYDNPAGWRYSTKSQGRDYLEQPVLNLLGATTPSWLSDGLPEAATEHGFTSRTVFVYEDEPRFARPFPETPDKELVRDLKNDLTHMAQLEGNFHWTQDAKEKYAEYYEHLHESTPSDHRILGYHHRKRTHVLKVAMLLSIAESDNLVLDVRDMEASIEVLEIVEKNMPRAFSGIGKYDYTSDMERVFSQIAQRGGMMLPEVIERNYATGPGEVQKFVNQLIKMGRLETSRRNGNLYLEPRGEGALGDFEGRREDVDEDS